jgi:stage II sporulation protein AA (anti-sigma F factor antagonist)
MATFETRILAQNQLALVGELTLSHAREARGLLRAALAESPTLELNLAQLERCDTAGVQVLLATYREAEEAGKRVRLSAPSSAVQRVLELLRLTSILVTKAA